MFKHTLWGLGGVRSGFRLRTSGVTDLPPALPLPPADPRTRIPESSRRRSACRGAPGSPAGTERVVTAREDGVQDELPTAGLAQEVE